MSPLERAARSLAALDGVPRHLKMDDGPLWIDYLVRAQAVLFAARIPSKAMISKAVAEVELLGFEQRHALRAWQTMIDTAFVEISAIERNSPSAAND